MSTSEVSLGSRPGLSNAVDIIIAPNAAFARIRQVPTWGWAFLVASLLGIAGTLLATPAVMHALDVSLPAQLAADPNIAKLPADQQQKQIAMVMNIAKTSGKFFWLLGPVSLLVITLIQALVMTIANAIARGDGSFKKFFALSMNVSIVGYGLTSLVIGVIATVRGAESFEAPTAVQGVLPSLALLVPGVHGWLAGFLGAFNVFYLWATALLALGMTVVARLSRAAAWTTAIVLLLLAACYFAYGARNG
ncbi:MAG: rane protein antimicrobial resistance system [Candidatus Eremiobacteraeota bacterium]|nr:rane protein antimicrobial resistance system [Candidatus Eremiobacteraeota bacterium]